MGKHLMRQLTNSCGGEHCSYFYLIKLRLYAPFMFNWLSMFKSLSGAYSAIQYLMHLAGSACFKGTHCLKFISTQRTYGTIPTRSMNYSVYSRIYSRMKTGYNFNINLVKEFQNFFSIFLNIEIFILSYGSIRCGQLTIVVI